MRTIRYCIVVLSLGGCSVTAANADGGGDAHVLPASCQTFHDLCVAAGSATPETEECHEFMHDTSKLTEALCASKKDGCIAACAAALDGGARDASADARTDATEHDH